MPTNPDFLALSQNDELLAWTYRWYRKIEDDFFVGLMQILGVLWTREDVERMGETKQGTKGAPDELMVPLALAIKPELRDALHKMFGTKGQMIGGGEYRSQPDEEVVNLGELPPGEFLQWANRATGLMRNIADTQAKPVTVRADEEPRLARIREQIRASKRLR